MKISKTDNIISVQFDDWIEIDVGEYPVLLHQFDTGQIIEILDAPDNSLIEFHTKSIEKAEIKYLNNNSVEIPNKLLEKPERLDVYVTYINEESITTKKRISITIKKRPKRNDDITPEDQQTFLEQITEIMNETKTVADSVREDADSGIFDGYTPIKGTDYFTSEEIEGIEDEAARKVDLSGLVPKTRMIGDETLAGDITKDKLGREVTKAFVAGGSWYGMLIPWLISQCGSKTQQDTNVAEIQSLKLTSGNKLALSIDTTNYVMTIALQNSDGTVLDEKSIDFPLESVVVSGLYDAENKQVVLTLQNGSEIRFSVSDLVNGLVSEDQLTEGLDEKVDKVTGKGLSTNDFTNELKIKLDGIDLTDYVTNTDYAQNNGQTGGVVKLSNGIYGIKNVQGGIIGIIYASDAEIEAQTSKYRSITPFNLSKAIKEGITNNSIELTSSEKKSVRDWIGVEAQIREWEKLVDKTLSADGKIALDYSDCDFGGKYKKIRIQIRGQMDVNNSNISFYRANIPTAYGICTNMGKTAETLYEFELEEKPFLRMDLIRESTMTFKSISASNNLQQTAGMIPIAQKMSETYELKINSNNNFLAGTRVVVWGCK